MWPVTQRFLDTLARSHEQRAYVEILQNGVTVAVLDSQLVPDPVTGSLMQGVSGSVQVARQQVRRSGSVTFVDISGFADPTTLDDLFPPLITEIRPWVGVKYWDAPQVNLRAPTVTGSAAPIVEEYVPIGTLVVTSLEQNYPTITASGYDRMWMIGPMVGSHAIAKGTANADAITDILTLQIPSSRLDVTNIYTGEYTTGALLYNEQDDAAAAVGELASTAGMVLFCDPMGAFTTQTEPSTAQDPVAYYAPGPLSVMMRPKRTWDASGIFNAVVFTGEATGSAPPVRGYAQDDNPNSKTYVGAIGLRP